MGKSLFKQTYINDLKEGDSIAGQAFVIKQYKKAFSKNNKPYIDLEIGDKTGNLKGKIWADNFDRCSETQIGEVMYVSGSVTAYNNNLQIAVSSLLPCDTFDVDDFIEVSKADRNEMFKEIQSYVQKIEDPDFKDLLEKLLNDKEFKELFKNATAAWTVHHSYAGGLMEHILDCLYLAGALVKRYPNLREDLLITGAIIHDFGKLFEFNLKTTITFSDRGRLLGHIYLACEFLTQNKPKGFPQEKFDELIHLILSHHGELEFGSPVKPKTAEAIALAMIDNTSAKVNMAISHIYDNIDNGEQSFSSYHRHLATEFYLKPYLREENGE